MSVHHIIHMMAAGKPAFKKSPDYQKLAGIIFDAAHLLDIATFS